MAISAETAGTQRRAGTVTGLALALIVGAGIAAQARINGELAAELGDPMLTAVISFGGGLAVLVLALPFMGGMRRGVYRLARARRDGAISPWHLLGGAGGAMLVVSQSVTVGVLGVALFTVGVVAGQTVSGLIVDKVGLGPAAARPINAARLIGAAIMLVAVLITMRGGFVVAGTEAWLFVFPVAAGFAVAVQQAVNGRVGAAAGSPMTAALVNFTVGTGVLVAGWVVSLAARGLPAEFPANPILYAGGLIGIAFIATAAVIVRWIGVLLLGLATITGQLAASFALDVLLPAHDAGVTAATVLGLGLALVAIVVASLPGRRRSAA